VQGSPGVIRGNPLGDDLLAVPLGPLEHLGEGPRRLPRATLVDEEPPRGSERLAQFGEEIVCDLPQRLRLAGEFADVVPVPDAALSEPDPRVDLRARAID
jgi:hypothetical protein